ncbi:MAG: hypothetical protein AAF664_03955 [Planctomycetota bacterium]
MSLRYPLLLIGTLAVASFVNAAEGLLTLGLTDEATSQPVISHIKIERTDLSRGKRALPVRVRGMVPLGKGGVLDREMDLALAPGAYQFIIERGPEYRILTGNFSLDATSEDQHSVDLTRIIDLYERGWVSGDAHAVPSKHDVPLQMASVDLHVLAMEPPLPDRPIPGRERDDPVLWDPAWVRTDIVRFDDLMFYGVDDSTREKLSKASTGYERLAIVAPNDEIKVALLNPLAWPVPVWIATGQVDAVFIYGNWLRTDRSVRSMDSPIRRLENAPGGNQSLGHQAEAVWHHLLNCGVRISPLAGTGDTDESSVIGYNRMYVAEDMVLSNGMMARPKDESAWWEGAFVGRSVLTNGPLLRGFINESPPGKVILGGPGLELFPAADLSTRDEVEYLEILQNGQSFYKARLDEFAEAGGVLPNLPADKSGWITMRVLTTHAPHRRYATTAAWYVDAGESSFSLVQQASLEVLTNWLAEYEKRLLKLPPAKLKAHVAGIQRARKFWASVGK